MANRDVAPELLPFFASSTERSRALPAASSTPAPATSPIAELLVFHANQELFGLPIAAVVEICRAPAWTAVPRTGVQTLGIMSLRGRIVPVVDLAVVLQLGAAPGANAAWHRVVILQPPPSPQAAPSPLGLRVDRVAGVVRLPAQDIAPRPFGLKTARQELVAGLCLGPAGMVVVLDVPAVLQHLAQL